MARPDPAQLDPARYPFGNAVTTRFADLDPNGHINNVAMAAVFEDARLRFLTAVGMPKNTDGARFMVANVTIDYLAQAYYPQGLECHVGVLPGGRSSWSLRQLLLQALRDHEAGKQIPGGDPRSFRVRSLRCELPRDADMSQLITTLVRPQEASA